MVPVCFKVIYLHHSPIYALICKRWLSKVMYKKNIQNTCLNGIVLQLFIMKGIYLIAMDSNVEGD